MNRHRSTSSSTTRPRRKNELLIEELANVAIIPAKSQGDVIKINLDVIETGVDERRQSRQNTDHHVVKISEDATSLMAGDADYEAQPQQRSNGYSSDIKVKNRRQSNRTEYTITKKLVAISTVHILLNLPSYAGNIKNFIDETIGSDSDDVDMILATWYFQQFAMV